MPNGDALEFADSAHPIPDSSPSSSALRGCIAAWWAPGSPDAGPPGDAPVRSARSTP